ncbi:MAG: membrane protein insertase YidC [Chitinophagales bacterium]|nr:membrane protein insertase YidC [Chitinophagales bacterium]HAE13266.1 membrane protein insertase YidC [Bacteroidota bacterium]HAE35541.1 membrane protein insertase YidC [Bacteroidota bacterium]HPE98555.1 membrane protein insertase YidC [Chitinophagales bacterium]HPR28179.1 membrane protein insertase YidC [Chitinophagales bacterium]
MDRNTIIGFVLLGVLFIGYLTIQTRISQKEQIQQAILQDSIEQVEKTRVADSLAKVQAQREAMLLEAAGTDVVIDSLNETERQALLDSITAVKAAIAERETEQTVEESRGSLAAAFNGKEETFSIENEELIVTFSNKGGRIKEVKLKQFNDYHGKPVKLVGGDDNRFSYSFFYDTDKRVSTDELYFTAVPGKDGKSVTYVLDAGDGRVMQQQYAFNDTSYLLDYSISMQGFDKLIPGNNPAVVLNWDNSMRMQEKNLDYERQYSKFFWKYMSGDLEDQSSNGEEKFDATISWVCNQQQFFNTTLIARKGFDNVGSVHVVEGEDSTTMVKRCETELYIPYAGQPNYQFDMQWYFAPNHFRSLKELDLGLEDIVPTGTGLSKFINRGVIIPLFHWLGGFISNYGLVILLMTLIIKLALSPLTYRSYLSMAKMRVLQPEIAEMKEKYKDDQQKQGAEQLKLFRKAGVNPLGGCIPTLLSMPILISLFRFFPGAIELRGKSFLWADDLSTYDDLIHWGFDLPFLGSHLSIFCVLMTVSSILYVRMNMSNATGMAKEMQFMQYIFPIFFLFFLNNYPAGLTFYYFVSNMTTFGQQFAIRRFFINDEAIHAKIQENKAKPTKKSRFAQRLEDAMKQQQEMQKRKK